MGYDKARLAFWRFTNIKFGHCTRALFAMKVIGMVVKEA